MSSCVKHLHQEPLLVTPRRAFKTDAFMQRNLYIHTDAPHTKTFAHKILASEKPLHRAAFIDRRLYTHTHKAFTQPNLCTHRCFHRMHMKDSTRRNFYTQKCLTQRNSFTEQLLNTRMEAFLHTEAFTH